MMQAEWDTLHVLLFFMYKITMEMTYLIAALYSLGEVLVQIIIFSYVTLQLFVTLSEKTKTNICKGFFYTIGFTQDSYG